MENDVFVTPENILPVKSGKSVILEIIATIVSVASVVFMIVALVNPAVARWFGRNGEGIFVCYVMVVMPVAVVSFIIHLVTYLKSKKKVISRKDRIINIVGLVMSVVLISPVAIAILVIIFIRISILFQMLFL